MKSKADLARGWLRKAQSDLAIAGLSVSAGEALDAACFHVQQVASVYDGQGNETTEILHVEVR